MPSRAVIEKALAKTLLRSERSKAASLRAWIEPLDALGWRIALKVDDAGWHPSEQANADMAEWPAKGGGQERDDAEMDSFWSTIAPERRFADTAHVRIWLPSAQAPDATGTAASPGAMPKLTKREREVWHWLREGKTGPEVALILGCAPRTVESHVARLYRKLGVRNRMELLGREGLSNDSIRSGAEGRE